MNKQTVRLGLKLSLPASALFFVALLLDYWRNDSAWMVPLLVLYATFVLAVFLLCFARPQARPVPIHDARPIDDEPVRVAIAERP